MGRSFWCFHAFDHADVPDMAAHEAADDDGEEEGEGYAEQVAAGRDGADEHHLVHFHGADDELMQWHTQRKAHQRPDEASRSISRKM